MDLSLEPVREEEGPYGVEKDRDREEGEEDAHGIVGLGGVGLIYLSVYQSISIYIYKVVMFYGRF